MHARGAYARRRSAYAGRGFRVGLKHVVIRKKVHAAATDGASGWYTVMRCQHDVDEVVGRASRVLPEQGTSRVSLVTDEHTVPSSVYHSRPASCSPRSRRWARVARVEHRQGKGAAHVVGADTPASLVQSDSGSEARARKYETRDEKRGEREKHEPTRGRISKRQSKRPSHATRHSPILCRKSRTFLITL